MANKLRLPLDVMSEIMVQSTSPIITSLMETCRLLYDEGPRHLLRGGVVLKETSQLESFVKFMMARNSLRFKFLHELDVQLPPTTLIQPLAIARLLELLTSPSLAIHALTLRDSEVFLSENKAALAGITTLRCLSLFNAGTHACHVVAAIPSKLTTLTLTTGNATVMDLVRGRRFGDGLSALEGLPSTIETLQCNLGNHQIRAWKEGGRVFPSVRTFGLVSRHCARPEDLKIETLARTFPNLTQLQLIPGQYPHVSRVPGSWHMVTINEMRHKNRAEQIPQSGFWPDLVECSGVLTALYVLGFIGNIPKLRILKQLNDTAFIPILRDVIEDMRPESLELDVGGPSMVDRVLSMLRALESQPVRELRLTIALPHDEETYEEGLLATSVSATKPPEFASQHRLMQMA